MISKAVTLIFAALYASVMAAQTNHAVVADAESRSPLPGASIFDRNGNLVGVSNKNGRTPHIAEDRLPVTVRYIGYGEKQVRNLDSDTIFLKESSRELPEVVVESRQHKVMHMLGYVREYSTLTTYNDTVFLFREKMVDYMVNPDPKVKFRGWTNPRILKSKSYYRFTNSQGLDSVSDESNYHFSWSDWVGLGGDISIPESLRGKRQSTDTLRGKYSPSEIWVRNGDKVTLNINVLADTASRRWVPNLSAFFRKEMDFENFKVRYNYDNVTGTKLSPMDVTSYSCNIESKGRGHDMFMFNRVDEKVFVSTYAETYILDKEYITLPEARKWEKLAVGSGVMEIYEPDDAPPLQASIAELIDRVNNVDKDQVKLAQKQDMSLVREVVKHHFGHRLLQLLKATTGISSIKAKRNEKKYWRKFRKERIRKNNERYRRELGTDSIAADK